MKEQEDNKKALKMSIDKFNIVVVSLFTTIVLFVFVTKMQA